ncbi:isochorismatase family protein [Streptomyces sp. I05A-00742]|uniref:isochorismatase family protein n=1 Tax=Streptomyces sp. I05A-00742 TaxID=2732853 RepID=UPI0037D995AB
MPEQLRSRTVKSRPLTARSVVRAGGHTSVTTRKGDPHGYEVYVVADASAGVTPAAHEHARRRMTAAGAVPVTWPQVLLEPQRDRAPHGDHRPPPRWSRSTAAPTARASSPPTP